MLGVLYDWLKFGHILMAIVWVGGAVTMQLLATRIHHLAKRAVGEDNPSIRIERSDAIGNRLKHRLEFSAPRLKRSVGGAELHGGLFDGAAAEVMPAGEVRHHRGQPRIDDMGPDRGGDLPRRGPHAKCRLG